MINKKLFEDLREIVNEYDFGKIGIEKSSNWDEYDSEIEKIIESFLKSNSFDDFYHDVYKIFALSIGVSKIGSDIERYLLMSKKIYKLLTIFQFKNKNYLRLNDKKDDLESLRFNFKNTKMGELPVNDLEEEIFAELDLTGSNLYGQLTNKNEYPPFDLKYANECLKRIDSYIKKRGRKNFEKNVPLSNWHNLCLKAVKVMGEYNKDE